LPRLTSLFVLTLTAPLAGSGQPAHGHGGEVRMADVEGAVEGMPYCDIELEGEPALPNGG
jgi:hypothetical protein